MKLHNLLNPKLLFESTSVKELKIEELNNKDRDNTLKEVIINNLPDDVYVFTTDKEIDEGKNKKMKNHFLNLEDDFINTNCDAILLYYSGNEVNIVCCELKSKKPKPIEYETQLINARLFIEYLISLFNEFYGKKENDILLLKEAKYVLCYYTPPILKEKSIRPTKTSQKETMKNYGYDITIISCDKTHHNYITWQELTI